MFENLNLDSETILTVLLLALVIYLLLGKTLEHAIGAVTNSSSNMLSLIMQGYNPVKSERFELDMLQPHQRKRYVGDTSIPSSSDDMARKAMGL